MSNEKELMFNKRRLPSGHGGDARRKQTAPVGKPRDMAASVRMSLPGSRPRAARRVRHLLASASAARCGASRPLGNDGFEAEAHRIFCDVAMMTPEGDVGEARARSQDPRPHGIGAKPDEAAVDNY
jgi:hypothetical protein